MSRTDGHRTSASADDKIGAAVRSASGAVNVRVPERCSSPNEVHSREPGRRASTSAVCQRDNDNTSAASIRQPLPPTLPCAHTAHPSLLAGSESPRGSAALARRFRWADEEAGVSLVTSASLEDYPMRRAPCARPGSVRTPPGVLKLIRGSSSSSSSSDDGGGYCPDSTSWGPLPPSARDRALRVRTPQRLSGAHRRALLHATPLRTRRRSNADTPALRYTFGGGAQRRLRPGAEAPHLVTPAAKRTRTGYEPIRIRLQ